MTGHGELWGRTWWWWSRHPRVQVDPHQVKLADTPVRAKVVAAYEQDPGRRSVDLNEPCVELTRDGRLVMHDGKHRALAARAAGRKLTVRLASAAAEHGRGR